MIEEYDQSEYCGFVFTADAFSGIVSAFKGHIQSERMENEKSPASHTVPGGEVDPCIGGGRKFVKQLQFLKRVGYHHVTGKMYPKMRHEILNEVEKEKVYVNILSYLNK